MDKMEYLDALKRAMTGLAQEAQAKTLAYYEQRFVDGVAAGRSEAQVAEELDDPKKIAMTLRASAHMQAFETRKNPANLLRMLFALIGLAIFNLFMVVPAMVYASLLAALYAAGVAFYLGGAVVTASGLSGNNQVTLEGPLRAWFVSADAAERGGVTKVLINEEGINVVTEAEPKTTAPNPAPSAEATLPKDDSAAKPPRSVRAIKRAEALASHDITVSTDMDEGSRATQTVFGLAMLVGGILLLLLGLVITKFTLIGIKRYIEMNYSLLKGN